MALSADEQKLGQCLGAILTAVQAAISAMGARRRTHRDESSTGLLTNTALDVNIYTFTLDKDEAEAMDELKNTLESTVNDHLPRLSRQSRKYLLDFLHPLAYNADKRSFETTFDIGMLDAFASEIEGTLEFIKAVQAAWQGKMDAVKQFVARFPNMKDKSGLWGTTLLYSAARNGHLPLVKYLIRTARCSVNAQNEQHVARLLPNVTTTASDFTANPTAGSTALHGACFHGYVDVVRYLLERGADYFLTNHATETPLENARDRPEMVNFLREFLVLGYSSTHQALPTKPIHAEASRQVDCLWEYKPFSDDNWYKFSAGEANMLQQALLVGDGPEFKRETHLAVKRGVYNVSVVKFLRSGRDRDYAQNCAWVRCRGSSVLNFDCCELWQILFIKHPDARTTSTMEMQPMPASYDSKFVVRLNTWYQCDVRTNDLLARTMDVRQKRVDVELSLLSGERLTVDLQSFTVVSETGSVSGYVRWIPKLIPRNAKHANQIIDVDQYDTLAQLDPVPLTTARFELLCGKSYALSGKGQEPMDDDYDGDDGDDLPFNATAAQDATDDSDGPETVSSVVLRRMCSRELILSLFFSDDRHAHERQPVAQRHPARLERRHADVHRQVGGLIHRQ